MYCRSRYAHAGSPGNSRNMALMTGMPWPEASAAAVRKGLADLDSIAGGN